MSGGVADVNRCISGNVEVIGEQSTMVSCPAKTKAEEVPSCGKFLDPISEPEETSSCAVPASVAKAEPAAGGAGNDKPGEPKNRMSNKEIRWILSRKPSDGPSDYRALKESNPDLTPSPEEEMDESTKILYSRAKLFYEMEESFTKFQEWVREELETKGYVELDDDMVRGRAEAQAAVEEAWKRIEEMLQSETEDDDDDDSYDGDDDDDEFY